MLSSESYKVWRAHDGLFSLINYSIKFNQQRRRARLEMNSDQGTGCGSAARKGFFSDRAS
jgi:hypothetical protein